MDITHATALVTGTNRGIGRALVSTLLEAGACRVYAAARDPATLAFTDPRVVPLRLDITDAAQVAAAARQAGDATLLINNAGVLDFGGPLEVSQAALERNFATNLFGPLATAITFAKTSAPDVANAIVAGIAAGQEDVFPDAMSQQVYEAWRQDHKAVERQFAAA
jgi:NAD(P)-dependent dehydrogenase (short-subunit alcohol dehydrogenase family)